MRSWGSGCRMSPHEPWLIGAVMHHVSVQDALQSAVHSSSTAQHSTAQHSQAQPNVADESSLSNAVSTSKDAWPWQSHAVICRAPHPPVVCIIHGLQASEKNISWLLVMPNSSKSSNYARLVSSGLDSALRLSFQAANVPSVQLHGWSSSSCNGSRLSMYL